MRALLGIGCVLASATVVAAPAWPADLAISSERYFTSGLFTNPLIASEGDTVTITVRATIAGAPGAVPATLTITHPDGPVEAYPLECSPDADGATATARMEWPATRNGEYRLRAVLDPAHAIAEANETNNTATLVLPVVVPGRKPQFPWWHEHTNVRWMSLLAGGQDETHIPQWAERGVPSLKWQYGNNLPKHIELNEEYAYRMYTGFGERAGYAVDEFGYYPDDAEEVARFEACLRGMARAKRDYPDKYLLAWHAGALHPQQVELYRDGADLVCLESYIFHYIKPKNIYDFLDSRMRPAAEGGLLNPTGKGPQAITTVDLIPGAFDAGKLEAIIRHLRRTWPAMRGFGFFGGLTPKDPTPEQVARADLNERRADELCYRYFVPAVVTILPGGVAVEQGRLQAQVSNIGGMDSGPVLVGLYADDMELDRVLIGSVPAGDEPPANRVVVSAPLPARTTDSSRLWARILEARRATVLDAWGRGG